MKNGPEGKCLPDILDLLLFRVAKIWFNDAISAISITPISLKVGVFEDLKHFSIFSSCIQF